MSASLESHELPGTRWVVVRGPLAGTDAGRLLEHVAGLREPRRLLLDLSAATAVDEGAVAVIARAHEALAESGGVLLLLPGEGMRSVTERLRRRLGDALTVVDRSAWGGQQGGWLKMTETGAPG